MRPPELSHTLHLQSAVDNQGIRSDRPESYRYYTNYTADFKDILDYIYIDSDNLTPLLVHPFPSEAELSRAIAIPSDIFPSDHIAIVTDLQYK